ncbi:unnamed protein product [Lepeophtheirus salmonis]|uniref:(salmon louse) hypothetical protein n=1 Tax=Lepeophtheirus salmonis TaxID=72036 RepID=A0A7R8CNW6_LEPSM|nr:unnamed protein product [Lepeophtheirus salmonis]CAF2880606.1 unnamed protein product [Lepeophtheirus salmonis]
MKTSSPLGLEFSLFCISVIPIHCPILVVVAGGYTCMGCWKRFTRGSADTKCDEEFGETDNANTESYILCEDDHFDEEELNPFAPSSSKFTKKKDRSTIPWKLIKDNSGR